MLRLETFFQNRIVQNIIVWFFLFLILSAAIQTPQNRFIAALFSILLMAPSVYVQNLLVVPYFRKNKQKFLVFTLLNLLFFTLLVTFLVSLSVGAKHINIRVFLIFLGLQVMTITFGAALKIARDSFVLKQEERKAELQLLKAQLNPHFLFNTLNNLYGLSVIKSDKLPNLMLKLSDLLRYSLYETQGVLVPLKKEIQYLENYISLERIRLEQTNINFTIEGEIKDQKIAPMLLIVFVENAFKHIGGKEQEVFIHIILENNKLQFKCINTIDSNKPIEENLEKGRSGIGLENAKKRLAILYPNRHELLIKKENNLFEVKIILEL